MHYDKFKSNVYSQNGEDGILNVLVEELGIIPEDSWVVDVGAYDGIKYSNVRQFINRDATAVLIEPSLVGMGEGEPKFERLQYLPNKFPKAIVLNCAVIPPSYSEEQKEATLNFIQEQDAKWGRDRGSRLPGLELDEILERQNRKQLVQECIGFLPTRVELDLRGWDNDIFSHSS